MLNSAPKFSKVNLHTNLIVRDSNAKPAAAQRAPKMEAALIIYAKG